LRKTLNFCSRNKTVIWDIIQRHLQLRSHFHHKCAQCSFLLYISNRSIPIFIMLAFARPFPPTVSNDGTLVRNSHYSCYSSSKGLDKMATFPSQLQQQQPLKSQYCFLHHQIETKANKKLCANYCSPSSTKILDINLLLYILQKDGGLDCR
jgi:hypothetical protein